MQTLNQPRSLALTLGYALVTSVAYVLCIHYIGVESMRYSDEVTHARVIQEGIDSGSWLRLTLDGAPYYNKPPFKMWLTRLVVALFGEGNMQFRILDGLATVGTIGVTMALSFRMFGSHLAAILTGLLLLGSSDFLVESRNNQGTQEAVLLLLITASMSWGWRLIGQARAPHAAGIHKTIFVLAVLIGLAISTKSLAGGLPAFLIALALALLLGGTILRFLVEHSYVLCAGALITVAIPGLYYLPLLMRDPSAWGSVFQGEIYNRLLGEGYHNQQRWDFYLSSIFVRRPTFPLAVMLLGAVTAVTQLVRSSSRAAWSFLLIWITIPLVLYSSFSSRVPHYIAPVFPPLAIMSGMGLAWATQTTLTLAQKSSIQRMVAITALSLTVLGPMYFVIGSQLYSTCRSISSSGAKLDIEKIVSEIQTMQSRIPTQVVLFNIEQFLSGTGNQVWRFKFYLHSIRDIVRTESRIEDVYLQAKNPTPLWVIAPLEHRELLSSPESTCEVRPFVHPDGKRNHYRSHEIRRGLGGPQFVLVRYHCTSSVEGVPQSGS